MSQPGVEKTSADVSRASSANGGASHDGPMFDQIPNLESWRRALIFIGLCFGLFLSLMDTSIMATAVYTISLEFNSLASTFWAVIAYQLAYLGFAAIFARLSDFIGRRVAVIIAFVLFVGFSLGGGWSQNINQLIMFRTFQGIGGAGLYAMALILLIEVSTARLITLTSTFIGGTIAIAGVLGPIVGGLFTQYATWRWIFWLNGPCGIVAAALFIAGWPNKTAYDNESRPWADFDIIGAILMLAASVLVVFGIQEGGSGSYSWSSSVVVATIVVGVICWILLFTWEYYIYRQQRQGKKINVASMFPFELVVHRPMFAGIIFTMFTGFTFFLVVISMPLRFQIVNLKSASSAGVHLLPLLCSCGFGSFLGGAISSRKNLTFYTFISASCLIMIGAGLLSTLGSSVAIENKCYGFQVILGLGVGLTFSGISLMTSVETKLDTHSVTQGIVAQVRVFGGSIGVAASNAMFAATSATDLKGILTPEQISDLQTDTAILSTLNETQMEAVRVTYNKAFDSSMRICLYFAAVSLVVSLFIWQKNPPALRQKSQLVDEESDVNRIDE
jgi:MFS family permease